MRSGPPDVVAAPQASPGAHSYCLPADACVGSGDSLYCVSALGIAAVPAASSRGVPPRVPPGGETPLELAAGTAALKSPLGSHAQPIAEIYSGNRSRALPQLWERGSSTRSTPRRTERRCLSKRVSIARPLRLTEPRSVHQTRTPPVLCSLRSFAAMSSLIRSTVNTSVAHSKRFQGQRRFNVAKTECARKSLAPPLLGSR
jgi:hypothetical protein